MVFSAENNQSENVEVSRYGRTSVNIESIPLIQGTTVKEYIIFTVEVKILNCTKSVLQSLLNNLETEILNKVDTILTPFNGQVSDTSPANYPTSTFGFGQVSTNVTSRPLVQGTDNPEEIVFTVEIQILNCNRTRLADILNQLNLEIMDKVNDIL